MPTSRKAMHWCVKRNIILKRVKKSHVFELDMSLYQKIKIVTTAIKWSAPDI